MDESPWFRITNHPPSDRQEYDCAAQTYRGMKTMAKSVPTESF